MPQPALARKVQLTFPFPVTRLNEAWEWHARSKALTARLGKDGWMEHFVTLLADSPSWGITVDGQLSGIIVFELALLPGDVFPQDASAHIALARRAWGKGVIQEAAGSIIPAFFASVPSVRRISAWTLVSNWPARAVAESLGFGLEGQMRDVADGEDLLIYGLTRRDFNGQRS